MIKKFHATTTRDALRQVRDALGANAIILSNRQVAGGVEIIAVADLDMANLTAQAEPAGTVLTRTPRASVQPARPPEPPPPKQMSLEEVSPQLTAFADYLAQRDVTPASPAAARPRSDKAAMGGGAAATSEAGAQLFRPSPERQARERAAKTAETPPPQATPAPEEAPQVRELAREIRMLRGLVEGQLAGFAWNDLTRRDPLRAETMKRLLAAGFSSAFAKQLLDSLPREEADLTHALKWVKSAIGHNLRIAGPEHDIVEQGGIYALVGPTGVGKTTTVAKLAARAVLRHGAAKVALVTTDTYRIGAQDQLRIYGRILGTPVFAVRDEGDLELTLADLSSRHLVLIDTVGMSQRDKRVAEQIALLTGQGGGEERTVKRLLLLGAPSQGVTLEEVARAYSGPGLIGCILTKIDEALTYGPVLDVAIRHELPLHYITNGQRVPEDLHQANPTYLADRAFRVNQAESPFKQEEGDYPILMAASRESARSVDAIDTWGALGAAG
ncbi:MAG: flagellar biosynthesis protein FlhF [Pseudomonadota bacterium]|nr:flagellar biosynthesis protein FlhF [Pseudomonadota bacterium]MDP1903696.1 flagellar biosynthesis protein FlhF [Pseudomonadota bacterium]MDP2351245.1 flagellar biosynthesis protein FlhF [Pseudomonadota bacterium]